MGRKKTPEPVKMTQRLEVRKISELIPYENNARTHPPEQIEKLRRSLREFGFVSPVLIDAAGNVIAGHGRLLAATMEGFETAPCVIAEHLSDAQRRAYILADNRLAELSGWDEAILGGEVLALQGCGIDIDLTGFDEGDIRLPEDKHFWETEGDTSEEYEEFVEKFKPKLTTDDCYTPANIYAAVCGWAVERYDLQGAEIIRPFFPGGDYQAADYPADCVVIDNPPFSILSEICAWYDEHGVRYFLFCPGVTTFSINSGKCNYLPCGNSVMFENGAEISISFLTNIGDVKIELAPDLYAAVEAANKVNLAKVKASYPVYNYPDNVCSVSINKLAKWGQALRICAADAQFIRHLDSQKAAGKAIYGGGFLLSEKAAAEKAAAEKAAAEKAAAEKAAAGIPPDGCWELSERELALIASMGKGHE